MPSRDKKVRVFISSTFKDMHAERDHLVTVVFPELRERCERLGLEFFDVDLRWGVPEKTVDGETANSWEYCRQWIDRVEPFFVCMLGQRYGWEPEPEQLKDAEDRARQLEQKRSITDMEVRYAVLNTKLNRRSYFYLRAVEAPATATDFVDPPPLLAKLDQLKSEVRACGRPVRDYPCEWKDNAFTGMEEFGKNVLADLWSGVLRDERYVSKDVWHQVLGGDPDADPRYTNEAAPVPEDIAEKIIPLAKPPPKNPLEAERDEMLRFAASRLRWFQGRTKELDDLIAFIRDPAEDNKPRLAVIAAVPGQGKSALMAKLSETLRHSSFVIRHFFIITHFVGATEQSSTAYALVKRLNDELDTSGLTFPERPTPEGQPKEEPKLDFNSLCQRLYERLGDYAGEKRIVILLDALNQLNDGHELGWLPYRLGPSVRVVVSCIEGNTGFQPVSSPAILAGQKTTESGQDGRTTHSLESCATEKVLTALNSRHPAPLRIPLSELTPDDVRTIVVEYLREYCHELDHEHLDTLCAIPQARNPLYLTVMLHELRTLGGNDLNTLVPARIAAMPRNHPDTVSLFAWVLQRMEAAEGFGKEAVQAWCLYLALGRVGMASRELADLLARKLGPNSALTAQRIERGLRRYLQRRGETLDFFHGQLRQAVMEKYGPKDEIIHKAHREIAGYFRSLADPSQDKQWKGEHQRPFNGIAFHFIGSGEEKDWDDLCAYLTDLACLDRRIRDQQIFAVVTDQRSAIATLPELAEEARRERERIEVCARYGDALIAYARECSAGKFPTLPLPPSSANRTNGRLQWLSRLLSFLGIGGKSQHKERLRIFANFTANHASLLSAWPEDFLPLAANHAEGGPLTESAILLSERGTPWTARSPRPPAPPFQPQCLVVLHGHTQSIESVGVSPNGRRAVSGGSDNTLRVWDLDSGSCLSTLLGHTGSVTSVSMTPDGRLAVSGSWDKTLRVWDLNSGQCLSILHGHVSSVESVSVTPDGRRAVSGSGNYDHTLRVWDLNSGQCIRILEGHTKPVKSVNVTPDGRRAVSGSDDNTLRVWDLDSGQCLQIVQGHSRSVTCVSVTPDGRRAVSCGGDLVSKDNTLRAWDLDSGKCLHTLQGHAESVSSVSVTPDGRRVVSVSDDDTLHLWNLDTGQCLHTLQGHAAWVTCVSVTPDGRRAVSGSDDETLCLWDLTSGQCLHVLQGHAAWVTCVSVTPDGRRAVSGSDDETLRLWDIDSGKCLHILQGHTDRVSSVSMIPDGRRAVSGGGHFDRSLRVWDIESGQCIQILQGHTGSVTSVSVTPNGRCAVSGSHDKTLRLWDLDSGRCVRTLLGHTDMVDGARVTDDGRRAVSFGGSGGLGGGRTLRIWDLDTGQCLHTLEHFVGFTCVNVTPDGRHAISGGGDFVGYLRVWDINSGRCLRILKGHTELIRSVSVTPDGRRAVSSSDDNTLRVWDLDSGQCLRTLQGHTTGVKSVSLTPDGRHAVSDGYDKTLRVWDIDSGLCLAVYHAGAQINTVAVSPVGNRIVCGTQDGQMHFLTMRNIGTGKLEMEKRKAKLK